MKPLLEVKELHKTFFQNGKQELNAVNGVSFALFPGEVLGIVGESGSGKSTLAKMITRLTDITGGSIHVDGVDITKAGEKELKQVYQKIQMVFQNPAGSFDPRRKLGDGIGESLRNSGYSRKAAREKVVSLLAQCGLSEEFADRYPHEVSGGECQRAAIARALAIQPKIMICDEATSSLDVTVQKQIIELLQSLRSETGLSFIFICHNLALVQAFCTRVLVMHEGRIVEQGTPDEVILSPKTNYTKELIASVL